MHLGKAEVIRADSRSLPLADDTVDLVVTSPPYFALRSYQDGGEHYENQIGGEPTPAEYVQSLIEVTAECLRVMKPTGSLWINLGDKYSTYESRPGRGGTHDWAMKSQRSQRYVLSAPDAYGVPYKSLMGLPWRYAIRCIEDLGLILRAEVIWDKPNGVPESISDRVRRSHETWFHFTSQPYYFSAVDEIREEYATEFGIRGSKGARNIYSPSTSTGYDHNEPKTPNPLGRLPGSVWTVPTEPLSVPDHLGVDHFAAFPTEWPKRIIMGWSPSGFCEECGQGRRPVIRKTHTTAGDLGGHTAMTMGRRPSGPARPSFEGVISGYSCACYEPTAPTTPSVILDPFGGTGTTAMVAKALGRTGISVDMSADYCRIAQWRTTDRDQLAKVLHVAKAEQQPDDQPTIFDMDLLA